MGKIPTGPMGYEEGWRSEFPEILAGVREVVMDRREDGTTSGMRAVDGYYKLKDGGMPVRQINVYDVKTDEEAIARARTDGLVRPILLEVFLGEPEPCTLFSDFDNLLKDMQNQRYQH